MCARACFKFICVLQICTSFVCIYINRACHYYPDMGSYDRNYVPLRYPILYKVNLSVNILYF